MLRKARRLNRHPRALPVPPQRTRRPALLPRRELHLRLLDAGAAAHAPAVRPRYLAELLRVLAPGGALVFQLPERAGPDPRTASARRRRDRCPTTRSARASPVTCATLSVRTRELFCVVARVANDSPHSWPALAGPGGTAAMSRWPTAGSTPTAPSRTRGRPAGCAAHRPPAGPGAGAGAVLRGARVRAATSSWSWTWYRRASPGSTSAARPRCASPAAWKGRRAVAASDSDSAARRADRRLPRPPPAAAPALSRLGLVPLARGPARLWRAARSAHAGDGDARAASREVEQIIAAGGGRLLETETRALAERDRERALLGGEAAQRTAR